MCSIKKQLIAANIEQTPSNFPRPLIMTLCQFCSNIPAKLFSFRREDQCSHEHQPTLTALQHSATQGCRGCQLFLHAVESSASEHAGRYKLSRRTWSAGEQVRLSSSKFGWQEVRINWTEAGKFRGFAVPDEWSMSTSSLNKEFCKRRHIRVLMCCRRSAGCARNRTTRQFRISSSRSAAHSKMVSALS